MTRRLTVAEAVLRDLGIAEPEEIDIEAIAWHLGAKVRYRTLHSCEARLIGRDDRAIISVDNRKDPRRQRFSIGHELGHWQHHRGRCLICRSEEIGNPRRSATDPERVADGYASDLLLPRYILAPLLRKIPKPTLAAIRALAGRFEASLTATLIKVVETDRYPIMIVCHGLRGRRWFSRSDSVERWFPREELDGESSAFALLYGSGTDEQRAPMKVGADAWFDRRGAEDYEVLEQSYRLPSQEIVTVVMFIDPDMIEGGE